MKRREFINWAGLGLIASCLPVALVACSESESTANTTNTEDLFSIGTVSQLEEAGYLLDKEAEVLVIKDSQGELIAINPTCTHQGCIVDWTDEKQFVCPCHYAKYAPNGEVLAKPATSPLATYSVQEDNGNILVSLS